jgi:hypothetical protein
MLVRLREARELSYAGQHEAACASAAQLLADATEVYRGSIALLAGYRYATVEFLLSAGRHADALRLAEETCAATAEEYGVESVPYAAAAQYLGRGLRAVGREDEAVIVLEDCWQARVRQWGAESPQALGAGIEFARALLDSGDAPRAAALLEEIRGASQLSMGSRAITEILLALAWNALGKSGEADQLVQEVGARLLEAHNNHSPWARVGFVRLAEYHRSCGDEAEAERLERLARSPASASP